MLITYRGRGGIVALVAFGAVALAAAALTAAITMMVVAVGVTAAVTLLLARALVPGRWRRRPTPAPVASWPHDTIEGTVVETTDVSSRPRLAEAIPRQETERDRETPAARRV